MLFYKDEPRFKTVFHWNRGPLDGQKVSNFPANGFIVSKEIFYFTVISLYELRKTEKCQIRKTHWFQDIINKFDIYLLRAHNWKSLRLTHKLTIILCNITKWCILYFTVFRGVTMRMLRYLLDIESNKFEQSRYKCDQCDKDYAHKCSLNAHKKKVHNVTTPVTVDTEDRA